MMTNSENPTGGNRTIISMAERGLRVFGLELLPRITRAQAMDTYARYFCEDAVKRWPTWFRMSSSSRQFDGLK